MVEEQHLMENVTGVLIMILLEMFQVLVLKILTHLILFMIKENFLVLGEGPINDINDSTDPPEKKDSINFSNIQTLLKFTLQW